MDELWEGEIINRSYQGKYPPDWEKRKEYIRKQYNCSCKNCCINLEDDLQYLDIHHTYSIPNEPHHLDSLVALCCLCHSQMPDNSSFPAHELMLGEARIKDYILKYDKQLQTINPYRKEFSSPYEMIKKLGGFSYWLEVMLKDIYPADRHIKGNKILITGKFRALSKKAILIEFDGKIEWFPLRYIGVDLDTILRDIPIEIEVPVWLYKKKFG